MVMGHGMWTPVNQGVLIQIRMKTSEYPSNVSDHIQKKRSSLAKLGQAKLSQQECGGCDP